MPGCAVALVSATFDTSDGRHRAVNACHCHITLPIFVRSLFCFGPSILVLYITLTAWPRARGEKNIAHFRLFPVRVPSSVSSPTPLRTPSCAVGATCAHRSLRLHVPHTHTHTHTLSLSLSLSLSPSSAGGRAINNHQSASPYSHRQLILPFRTLTQTLRLRFSGVTPRPPLHVFASSKKVLPTPHPVCHLTTLRRPFCQPRQLRLRLSRRGPLYRLLPSLLQLWELLSGNSNTT